jgi:hypothetical protein
VEGLKIWGVRSNQLGGKRWPPFICLPSIISLKLKFLSAAPLKIIGISSNVLLTRVK